MTSIFLFVSLFSKLTNQNYIIDFYFYLVHFLTFINLLSSQGQFCDLFNIHNFFYDFKLHIYLFNNS